MKFLRNLLIATTAVVAMSATAAFADATATYTDGSVAVTGVDTSVFGDQVTVVIVPDGTTTVAEDDIYYINQDDQTGITTILAGMGMKELAEGDPSDFEVWIGGSDVSETNPIIKIDFATVVAGYLKGDVNDDKQITITDLNAVLKHYLNTEPLTEGTPEYDAANVDGVGGITITDLNAVLKHYLNTEPLWT